MYICSLYMIGQIWVSVFHDQPRSQQMTTRLVIVYTQGIIQRATTMRIHKSVIYTVRDAVASWVDCCIRHSVPHDIPPPATTFHSSLQHNRTVKHQTQFAHQCTKTVDGVVHAGTATVTTTCTNRLHLSIAPEPGSILSLVTCSSPTPDAFTTNHRGKPTHSQSPGPACSSWVLPPMFPAVPLEWRHSNHRWRCL